MKPPLSLVRAVHRTIIVDREGITGWNSAQSNLREGRHSWTKLTSHTSQGCRNFVPVSPHTASGESSVCAPHDDAKRVISVGICLAS